jgi:sulfur carrier protein ThiS
MVNKEEFLPREELAKRVLKAGDRVCLMLLAGGG